MPLTLPRAVARFNRLVNNPIQRQYAWLLPPWAILVHRGRRSDRVYRTPVNAFVSGGTLAVPVLYGERTDWVRNLLAGDGQVVRGGRTYPLHDARLLSAQEARAAGVSRAALGPGRLSDRLLVARLGPPEPGFGRGPRASR
jgi:deazaflavin-dependent oxidoreductase (nitroreductase family)